MKKFSDFRQKKLNESVLMYASTQKPVTKEVSPAHKSADDQTPFSKILASANNNTTQVFKLEDGTVVQINPIEAKSVAYTYEELNTENQAIFECLINNSIETYQLSLNFCKEYLI